MTSALVPALAYSDPAMLQEVLGLVAGERDLSYVVVIDANQRRLAHVGDPPDPLPPATGHVNIMPGQVQITRDIHLEGQKLGTLGVAYATGSVDALTGALRQRNVILAIIVLGLSILAAITFGLMITRRLRRLKEGAQAFRAGNLRPSHRKPHQRRTRGSGAKPQCPGHGTGSFPVQPAATEHQAEPFGGTARNPPPWRGCNPLGGRSRKRGNGDS
jgi:hypothetical protein